jgi:radical SAM protein with 4Fe4S-binding SPASM domain
MEPRQNNGAVSREGYVIGLGLTDRCTTQCAHCYSRPQDGHHELDFQQVLALLGSLSVRSVNFGTGESMLYPRFLELVHALAQKGIPMAVTTNGFTVRNLSDGDLRLFHDVDFSLDFPDPMMNDTWRGLGSFQGVYEGIQRCREQGVEASLVTCLMKENYAYLGKLAELAAQWGVNLRVNVYKSVLSHEHQADYRQFWQAIADMAQAAYFTACSEPIVNAAIGNGRACHGIPCGQRSFRVHPDGLVTSCVYLQDSKITISQLIDNFEGQKAALVQALELQLPEVCRSCPVVEICGGGCASRRLLGQSDQPDEYCFVLRKEHPVINARWKASKDLVHENYLCTMIFCG